MVSAEEPVMKGVEVKSSAGAVIVKYKPLFSHDSKYLFIGSGAVVKVFSMTSGECVRQLKGHENEVASFLLNPKNHLQLVTCCSRGQILFWDYLDGIIYKRFNLNCCSVERLFWPSPESLFYVQHGKSTFSEVEDLEQPLSSWKVILRDCSENANHIAVGLAGKYFAAINVYKIRVYFPDNGKTLRHSVHHKQTLTCLATHPSDYCFATGDTSGKIYLWYNFAKSKFTKSTIHWHQLPVADLAFTTAGSALLSGGGECVLVRWTLDSSNKTFVPRLGMPIKYISTSPDHSLVATSHVDNGIQIVSSLGNILQVIQGLTKGHHWEELNWDPVPTGLLHDPRSKALVLNGRPGHLQFYQLDQDRQLFNLDITKVNYHHSERTFKVYPIEIERAAFDSRGDWLATVERRDDTKTTPEIRLKFWKYRADISNFTLNTKVEMPHLNKISAMLFQPITDENSETTLFVTSSHLDKRFKFWELVDDSDIYKKKSFWNCESVGYYRDMPCDALTFSEDGSVLAVACNHVLTLWNAKSCSLSGTLCHPRIGDDIREVEFGLKDCSRFLVCTTNNSVNVWDVISLTIKWCVDLDVTLLVKDYMSSMMAIFTKDCDLFVFKPSMPNPIYQHKQVSKSAIVAAVFIPNQDLVSSAEQSESKLKWQNRSTLYFLNNDQSLLRLQEASETETNADRNVRLHSNIPLTPFGMLLAKDRKSGFRKEEELHYDLPQTTSEVLREMFSSPSNTLPPVHVLYDLHLESCLRKAKPTNAADQLEETKTRSKKIPPRSMDIDSDSDSDFVVISPERVAKPREKPDILSKRSTAQTLGDRDKSLEKIATESYEWLFL